VEEVGKEGWAHAVNIISNIIKGKV
jgi:hypothetical protein